MLVPRAYEKRPDTAEQLDGFYRYHSRIMEPWDGPAGLAFTDGRVLGAALDRNGLRPGRWLVTRDGWVAVSSEAGAFFVPDEDVEAARPPAPRRHVPRRPGPRPGARGGRGRAPDRRPVALRGLGRSQHGPRRRSAVDHRPGARGGRADPARPARLRLLAGGPAGSCWRRWRATARSRPARWATTSRSPCSPSAPPPSTATSSSASPRSRTRRSTRSGRRS